MIFHVLLVIMLDILCAKYVFNVHSMLPNDIYLFLMTYDRSDEVIATGSAVTELINFEDGTMDINIPHFECTDDFITQLTVE